MIEHNFSLQITASNKIYVTGIVSQVEMDLANEDSERSGIDCDQIAIDVIEKFINMFKGIRMPSFTTSISSEIIMDGPNRGLTAIDIEICELEWLAHAFIFDSQDRAIGVVDIDTGYVAFAFDTQWIVGTISAHRIEEIDNSGHFRLL